jgi:hypothetical protein
MSFYTDIIRPNPLFASTTRIADLGLLEPVTRAAVQQIILDAASQGIKLMVFET